MTTFGQRPSLGAGGGYAPAAGMGPVFPGQLGLFSDHPGNHFTLAADPMPRHRYVFVFTIALLAAALAGPASAQTANQASRLGWNEDAPTLGAAASLVYEASFNGGAFVPLAGVGCTGAASPFQCSAPIPALTQGPQVWVLRAVAFDGPTRFESPLSAAFNFTFTPFLLPAAPTNLRIIPGE